MRKKKKTEQPEKKRKKKELASAIIQFLNENPDKQYNYKQISAALEVSAEEQRTTLRDVLDKLRDDELVLETQRGKYKTNDRKPILEGRFERRSNGKNFFVPNCFIIARSNSSSPPYLSVGSSARCHCLRQ